MMMFTLAELGRQDFERGEPRGHAWPERAAGWDEGYRDSLLKAAGGLRRVHAGRYESEDGYWSIVEAARGRWSVLQGFAPGLRTQAELVSCQTFADAMAALRGQLDGIAQ